MYRYGELLIERRTWVAASGAPRGVNVLPCARTSAIRSNRRLRQSCLARS